MKNSHNIGTYLTGREMVSAGIYLVFQIFLLTGFLQWANAQMASPLNKAELNFLFYLINFMAMLLIFHDFLGRSARQVTQHPLYFCEAVILGFVAYYALNWLTTWLIGLLVPGFSNYNDEVIYELRRGNPFLMFIGTVILVPPFEECMYRGLVFKSLYRNSKPVAYIASIMLFALIHIIGYIGRYSILELLMAFLQYLPAGLCLAWSYVRGDTIFAPIVIHAAINYIAIGGLR